MNDSGLLSGFSLDQLSPAGFALTEELAPPEDAGFEAQAHGAGGAFHADAMGWRITRAGRFLLAVKLVISFTAADFVIASENAGSTNIGVYAELAAKAFQAPCSMHLTQAGAKLATAGGYGNLTAGPLELEEGEWVGAYVTASAAGYHRTSAAELSLGIVRVS